MSQPPLSSLLAQVATIAVVKSTSLGITRLDKEASRQADQAHGAQAGTVRANVARLTPTGVQRVKDINSCAAELQDSLKGMTTAWGDMRLLNNLLIERYLALWGAGKNEYDKLVAAFVADAPAMIAQAEQNLQGFVVKPPTEKEIQEAFSLTFEMKQIPDATKYQASGVDKALEKQMARHFEAGIEAAYQNATKDALTRVAKPLSHLIERIASYGSGDSKRFYDSTITNVQDIAAVFESFNLKGDPFMAKIADQLHAFDGIEAEDLKSSPELRTHVAKTAETILAELADLI